MSITCHSFLSLQEATPSRPRIISGYRRTQPTDRPHRRDQQKTNNAIVTYLELASVSSGGKFLGIPSGGEAALTMPIPRTISRPTETLGKFEFAIPPRRGSPLSSPAAMTGVLARSSGCKCVRDRPRGPMALARADVPPNRKLVDGGVDSLLRKF